MSEFVRILTADGVGTLLLERPPTNTVTRQMYREIASAAEQLAVDASLTAVIVYGGHEVFSAGADAPELLSLDADELAAGAQTASQAYRAVAEIPVPTVAALTGYALGGGLTLALAADWRIAGDNLKWAATQIADGIAPTTLDAQTLARAIGDSRARELMFSGRFASATEALDYRLVDELVAPDHVYESALAWARQFADRPRPALTAVKAAFRRADTA